MSISKRAMATGVVSVAMALAAGAWLRGAGGAAVERPLGAGLAPAMAVGETFSTDVAMAVEGQEAVLDTLVLAVSASGQAEAWRRAVVTAEAAGRVERVRVRESDSVEVGDVLVALDDLALELALDEARAVLREAEGRYREQLLFDGDLPEAVRRERRAAARLRSGLERAEIQLRKARLELDRTRVRAPFGGRVASLAVVPGQQVAQGSPLLTLLDLDPIRVESRVLEGELAQLVPGAAAEVRFSAFPDRALTGTIESINPLVEEQTRTARVTVLVPNPDGRILPGMYARVRLAAQRIPDRVLVPREAILERDRRTLLFVEQGGRAKWRYVTTGRGNETHVEIVQDAGSDGVAPGEIVLTGGHFTLTHDAPIRLDAGRPPPVAGGSK